MGDKADKAGAAQAAESANAGGEAANVAVAAQPEAAPAPAPTTDIDALMAHLERAEAALKTAAEQIGALTGERDAARVEAEGAKAAIAAVEKDFVEVSGQRDRLQTEVGELGATIADLRTQLAKATKAGSVTRGAKPARAREAVPMEPVADRDALLAGLDARPHEIVFSDGSKEILSLEPFAVAGKAVWTRTGRGLMLNVPLRVRPERRVELAGFALLDAKGKQLAWSALMQPLAIDAGQEVKLDRQIIF